MGCLLGRGQYVKPKSHDRHASYAPNAHACRAKNSARKMWEIGTESALVMSAAAYLDSLDYEARKRYFHKLQTESEVLPDPYSVVNELWIDDVRMWPNLEFGDLYTYLIETKGPFTKESLKAYKSLEAFN